MEVEKEKVLISMCSIGIPCQYKPRSFKRKVVEKYFDKYFLIPICPEQLGGLSTPRIACHIESDGRVVGKDKKDYTLPYKNGAEIVLRIAKKYGVKMAYLKKGSPSCGKKGITRELLEKNGIKVLQI